MRRRVMALTVAAVMAAMMVAGPAGPALAYADFTVSDADLGGADIGTDEG